MNITLSDLFISFLNRFDKWELLIDTDEFIYSDYQEIPREIKSRKITAFSTRKNHYTMEDIITIWIREAYQ